MKQHYIKVICLLALIAMCTTALADDKFKYTTEIPEGILTPNEVKTSIDRSAYSRSVSTPISERSIRFTAAVYAGLIPDSVGSGHENSSRSGNGSVAVIVVS